MIDYIEAVQDRVIEEYEEFKKEELIKTKEQIYDDHYKINFYENVCDFLSSCDDGCLDLIHFECLHQTKGSIVENLYQYYLKFEYASIEHSEDILDLVISYNKKYHRNILNKTAEAE